MRRLNLSYDWQDAMIRAAITLKLSNFEETGGIVAAHTTSIPEAPGSRRNWDYRYCWLRDAYFVVKALNRIGATQTMEDFISFILSIASDQRETLRPVYSIVPTDPMDETHRRHLKGYRGDGPVRIGNAAAMQDQHDTYGSIILAAMPMFFDQRLPRPGDESLFRLLEPLGEKAAALALEPDAGIWEFRGRQRVHTHSAAMCWAGCNRLAAIAPRLGFAERAAYWNELPTGFMRRLLRQGLEPEARTPSPQRSVPTNSTPASCCCPNSALSTPNDPRFVSTVEAIERELLREQACYALRQLRRFRHAGDRVPDLPVLADRCLVVARPQAGGARSVCRRFASIAIATACCPKTSIRRPAQLWGNFPQTYSMAGLILTAMRLSRSWEDRYWRG